jgi:hypothetical protein
MGEYFFPSRVLFKKSGRKQPFPTCHCVNRYLFISKFRKDKDFSLKIKTLTGQEGLFTPAFFIIYNVEKKYSHSIVQTLVCVLRFAGGNTSQA